MHVLGVATAEGVAFIGAAATILAALILGGLAACNADRRQTAQIADAGERQKRELVSEAERQGAALAHDRELADIADLRDLLDEAAVALDLARDAILESRSGFRGLAEDMAHGGLAGLPVLPTDLSAAMADQAGEKLEAAGRPLVTLAARLRVRLGPTDPIAAALTEASMSLETVWRAFVVDYDEVAGFVSIEEAVMSAGPEFAASAQRFFDAAVTRAGTSVRDSSSSVSAPVEN